MLTGAQKGQGGYLTLGKLSMDSRFNLLSQSTDHIYWLNVDGQDYTRYVWRSDIWHNRVDSFVNRAGNGVA